MREIFQIIAQKAFINTLNNKEIKRYINVKPTAKIFFLNLFMLHFQEISKRLYH